MIKNAVPKKYTAYYIEPGLADYTAEGIGVILVQKAALDRMMSTFVGMPVVNFDHTDKEPHELFEMSKDEKNKFADGIVSSSGYDEKSGWYFVEMMIWNQETMDNIDKNGYSVSCAYDITEADETGGTDHNVDYDGEVLNGNYLHMAVVPNPRYEKAWIMKNSKSIGGNVKFKFLKKKVLKNQEPVKKPDEEEEVVVENAEGGVVELPDGKTIPIEELIAMYKEKKDSSVENSGDVYNMEDTVDVDGESMSVKDMYNMCYPETETVENSEPAQDEVADEVIDESAQKRTNSVKNSKEVKKVNKVVKNAANRDAGIVKPNIQTKSERLELGKSRYGSKVQQGGN